MAHSMNRRSFLLGSAGLTAATAIISLAPSHRVGAVAASATKLTIGHRTLEVKGRSAQIFGIMRPNGVSGLTLEPGDRFLIDLVNDAGEETMLHWHGQKPPFLQDGFPDKDRPLIAVGATERYDYAPTPGTHWIHSHHGLQAQRQMNAPLIVRSAEDARVDLQEVVIFLDDFSFTSPEDILAGLTGDPAAGHHDMHGMMEMGDEAGGTAPAEAAMSPGMDMSAGTSTTAAMNMRAAPGMSPDLNDVKFDAFLANDRTLEDPEVVRVERGGRVLLRIINAAASSQFWIDLGALTGTLVAVDGVGVKPISDKRFPMAIAQRLDLIVDIPTAGGAFPILAEVEGLMTRTGIVLASPGAAIEKLSDAGSAQAPAVDLSLEIKLRAVNPLPDRPADLVIPLALTGSMTSYVWSINNEVWPKVTRPLIREGQRVVLDIRNETGMAHPMHLHGHTFQVISMNGGDLAGAVRDTVLVPPNESMKLAFDADNPGRWPFHCHNLYHQATGMMTEFAYEGFA